MSQGTSGDQHWMDYGSPEKKPTLDEYAASVARAAASAYAKIIYHDHVPLTMAETTLKLKRRVPDAERLAWARKIVADMGDRVPKSLPEVYAKEAIYLHDEPERELKLQALRIGNLAIAAIPNEVYALSGLKIKGQSPLTSTFVVELANGSEGYIPPAEQHKLGGYTTWPARTAALEEEAESKIVASIGDLLEKVADKPSRKIEPRLTPYAEAVLKLKPWAFWRLEEISGVTLADATGQGRTARIEGRAALYLDGMPVTGDAPSRPVSRAIEVVNGTIEATVEPNFQNYSAVFAYWNPMPANLRTYPSRLFPPSFFNEAGRSVGIGGRENEPEGRLFVRAFQGFRDAGPRCFGTTPVGIRQWRQIAIVLDLKRITVFLDGRKECEAEREPRIEEIEKNPVFGSNDCEAKFDEIALFDRPLTEPEIGALFERFRVKP